VPLPRKLNPALLQVPGRLRDSVLAAGAVLDRVRAEVVVGFGGYVAGPAYLAARRRGLPIVVHEANARPGVANRLAARMTTHVFTAAPGVRLPHATAIGIPLRPAITGLDRRCRPGRRRSAHPTRASFWPGRCSPRSPSDAGSAHDDPGGPRRRSALVR
jgi:UDP-N-acetylglucosamine:LPS N-acetylglucosamine transferase